MFKFIFLLILLNLLATQLIAQLSPGDLHKSHAHLEGIENCTKCHSQGQKLDPANCLNCHTILKEQISKNEGLHSNSDYSDCAGCHVDHLGKDYEMVYWGKGGKGSFDHSKTGYTLEGVHQNLDCEKCHRESNMIDPSKLKQKGKDLNRTYLGLDKQCLSCHRDEHREQMDNNCLSCHNMNNWNNASGFEHNKTAFKLNGKHQTIKCEQCHKPVTDNKYIDDKSFLNFSVKKFNVCQDCHKDIHQNRFGSNCTKCHNTSGWHNYNQDNFDHNNTNYPLLGKHAQLQCGKCHPSGQPMKINKYQNCTDCHGDYHMGQFKSRTQKGACSECHSVEGFSPANFTLDMHQQGSYPLIGSHLAVPCLECHKKVTISVTHQNTFQFRFQHTACTNCHIDIHQGATSNIPNIESCESCHSISSWHEVRYDHNKTQFRLEGKHSQISCAECHKEKTTVELDKWRFQSSKGDCINCHNDIHLGQFNDSDNKTDCSRCHSPIDWFADRFEHDVDARFSLKGAHEFVPCQKCHEKQNVGGSMVSVYKPLDFRCESCHH